MKTALSIAGSDCSGGAGIQADLKAFAAHGVFGMSAVTSVVAENTFRVVSYQDVSPTLIAEQLDAIFEDIPPHATKIGMLSTRETMLIVAKKLRELSPKNVVIDPVMYAKNGAALMDPSSIDTLIAEIAPLADVITPNIPEAEQMTGLTITTLDDMKLAATRIHAMGARAVIVKGGHLTGDAVDLLFDGTTFTTYPAPRVDTKHTHGTGCTFSSAIAANLALGHPIAESVRRAKAYIHTAIIHAPKLGRGHGPTHHFYDLYQSHFGDTIDET